MNPNWAEENLKTIRTLMERSTIYRRALAPIMIFCGTMGIAGGLVGWLFQIEKVSSFLWLWSSVAIFSLAGALWFVRHQAMNDSEPFWSPPTRRIAQAVMPAFLIGLTLVVFALIGCHFNRPHENDDEIIKIFVITWAWFYGCAIHAAGFFMPRGIRWLGWIFIFTGILTFFFVWGTSDSLANVSPHLLMASIFGGLHLAYGIYLYYTEKKNPAT